LTADPGLLVCDGYGLAHPRRFGLASHLGVLTGRPSIGVAKNPFTFTYEQPGPERGDFAPLLAAGDGYVLPADPVTGPYVIDDDRKAVVARLDNSRADDHCEDGGYGDEGYGDEGYGDEGYGDQGYGDSGYGSCLRMLRYAPAPAMTSLALRPGRKR
ncbi:endonuclease V, partial [Streptomyces massasporeus]